MATHVEKAKCVIWIIETHSSLMMEAVHTSETSVDNYFTRQYIPEDNSEQRPGRFRKRGKTFMHDVSNSKKQGVCVKGKVPVGLALLTIPLKMSAVPTCEVRRNQQTVS
jgi:hypothetical protein